MKEDLFHAGIKGRKHISSCKPVTSIADLLFKCYLPLCNANPLASVLSESLTRTSMQIGKFIGMLEVFISNIVLSHQVIVQKQDDLHGN